MAESFVQVPVDSTGKKLRTRQRVIGANTVEEQMIINAGLPTYYFWTGFVAGAASKIHIDLFNATGSGVILRVKKLFIQSNMAAQTGGANVFDIDRTSAVGTAGTTITPNKADTTDAALPAQVTARAGPTGGATKSGGSLFQVGLTSEETLPGNGLSVFYNLIPESVEVLEPVLRVGEGIRVFQSTFVAGTWGVLAVVTVE